MAKAMSARRGLTEREQFWLGHLRKIEAAGIAAKVYAERAGLSVGALYQARVQLGTLHAWPERKATRTPPVFMPVRVVDAPMPGPACRLRLANGAVLEWSAVPAPEVLAVVLERMGGAR
jgi:hypothetical protein